MCVSFSLPILSYEMLCVNLGYGLEQSCQKWHVPNAIRFNFLISTRLQYSTKLWLVKITCNVVQRLDLTKASYLCIQLGCQ